MDSSLSEEETLHRDDAIAVSTGMEQPGQGGRFRAHTSFLHNVRGTSERGSFRGLPSLVQSRHRSAHGYQATSAVGQVLNTTGYRTRGGKDTRDTRQATEPWRASRYLSHAGPAPLCPQPKPATASFTRLQL